MTRADEEQRGRKLSRLPYIGPGDGDQDDDDVMAVDMNVYNLDGRLMDTPEKSSGWLLLLKRCKESRLASPPSLPDDGFFFVLSLGSYPVGVGERQLSARLTTVVSRGVHTCNQQPTCLKGSKFPKPR
jgi:hypothetical protein